MQSTPGIHVSSLYYQQCLLNFGITSTLQANTRNISNSQRSPVWFLQIHT